MDFRKFLEDKSTYGHVMGILARESGLSIKDVASKIKSEGEDKPWTGEVNIDGFIAGGAVANIINYMLYSVKPVIRDVDIFYPYNREINYIPNIDASAKHDSTQPSCTWVSSKSSDMEEFRQAFESELTVDGDWYGNKWVQPNGDFCLMKSHFRQGMANYVEVHAGLSRHIKDKEKARDAKQLVILKGFDINSCQIGIDIKKEKLVYTEDFLEFIETRQMKVTIPVSPIQTSIRLIKKMKDMQAYCDINNELKLLQYATFCTDKISNRFGSETYQKYLEHKDDIDMFFEIVKVEKPERPAGYDDRGFKYEGMRSMDRLMPSLMSDGIGRGFYVEGKELWLFAPKLRSYDLKYHLNHPLSLINYWRMNEDNVAKTKKKKIGVIMDYLYKNGIRKYNPEEKGSWRVKSDELVEEVLLTNEMGSYHKYKAHGITSFGVINHKTVHRINHWLWFNLIAHKDYYDCDFHIKHIDFVDKFMEEHRGLRWLFDNSRHYDSRSVKAIGNNLQSQYKAMKMIKTIANKRGEWIIGELENLNYDKREELISSDNPAEWINEYMDNVEKELSEPLVEPLSLEGFELLECVTELITVKDLRSEGTKMGHCVGGYGNSIKDGRSRIFHIERNGIGSTVEIGFGGSIWPKFDSAKAREIPAEWEEFASRSDIRELKNYDNKLETTSYTKRQHYGRYPEKKGNQTPTDENQEVVTKLVEYLDEHHKDILLKDILYNRHILEEKIRKEVYDKQIEKEKIERAEKARQEGKDIVTIREYPEWGDRTQSPVSRTVPVEEILG